MIGRRACRGFKPNHNCLYGRMKRLAQHALTPMLTSKPTVFMSMRIQISNPDDDNTTPKKRKRKNYYVGKPHGKHNKSKKNANKGWGRSLQ